MPLKYNLREETGLTQSSKIARLVQLRADLKALKEMEVRTLAEWSIILDARHETLLEMAELFDKDLIRPH